MVLEFYYKLQVRGEPLRALTTLGHQMIQLSFEPLKQGTFQVRDGEDHTGFVIRELLGTDSDEHQTLEDESVKLVLVGTIKGIRVSGLDGIGGRTPRGDVFDML